MDKYYIFKILSKLPDVEYIIINNCKWKGIN